MSPDYNAFFELMEQAMEPKDLKDFRRLKNKYYQYFKQGIRDSVQPILNRNDDSGIDFIRLSDD